uniref:Uncharacterized protein n=1 Tax=Phage sp. ctGns7 TaxID=2828003 RepID=A0A8S5S8Z2_9VIRU|nr:MAG TPA: hypothetical protein [Phage sp. ctGns7]
MNLRNTPVNRHFYYFCLLSFKLSAIQAVSG